MESNQEQSLLQTVWFPDTVSDRLQQYLILDMSNRDANIDLIDNCKSILKFAWNEDGQVFYDWPTALSGRRIEFLDAEIHTWAMRLRSLMPDVKHMELVFGNLEKGAIVFLVSELIPGTTNGRWA